MKRLLPFSILLFAACATQPPAPSVERMYVIECGENHVKDLSRWTPGVNVGTAHVFANHCYLIKHVKGWMLWDTGNPDRFSTLANGFTAPNGLITAYMKKPLSQSLTEIGIEPAKIEHFAMSHSHGDHSGNANLFHASTLYMQAPEHDAVFGPEPQKYNFLAGNFERLKGAKTVKLNGDHDVFGDGSVLIKSTPGHTPGHQSLAVRLPVSGWVLLTGDLVHLQYSWDHRVVPAFNFDVAQSGRSIDAMKEFVAQNGARIWVNHDKELHERIPKAPKWVE